MYENYFHDRDLRWIIGFPNVKGITRHLRQREEQRQGIAAKLIEK